MLKQKYLHRKIRKSRHGKYMSKRHFPDKNIDLFSDDLPTHKGLGKKYREGINTEPLEQFIKSKIGEDWNDVYSEILTKIKPKFRYEIDWSIGWIIPRAMYDEFFVPRHPRGYILIDRIFIDINNVIVKKTEEEIIYESEKYYMRYMRIEKLKKIIEQNEKEDEIPYNDE